MLRTITLVYWLGSVNIMKLNKNIIMYITEDLEEKTGFLLNCKTNEIIKLDQVGVEYLKIILNARKEDNIKKYLDAFKGCDIFE